jgi:hypothetical protein
MLRRRIESAGNTQRRAWDLFHERQLRPALRLTLQARDMLTGLTSQGPLGGRGPFGGEVGVDAQLDRLEAALERVSERLEATGNEPALQHWERAHATLGEARHAHENGDDDHAEQLLHRTRTELESAMRILMKETRTEEIAVLLASARERWELAVPGVQESGDSQLSDWLTQADKHLNDAEHAHAEGNNQRALILTRRAIDLLDRIAGETGQ